jgi:cell division protein FtsQ
LIRPSIHKNYYRNSRARKRTQILRRCVRSAKILTVLLAFGAVSFLFILAHDALVQSPYFKAENIAVAGNHRLSTQAVLEQAKIGVGDNILQVNLKLVRYNLLANPWIASADVERDLPNIIRIRIREHEPVAVVELGRPFLLSDSGEVFKSFDPADDVQVPMVRGLSPSDVDPTRSGQSPALRAVMEVLRLTRLYGSVLPTISAQSVQVDHEMGLTLQGFENGMAVRLGFGDYESKLNRLRDMIAYLRGGEQLLNVGLMDLNDLDRVVVRPSAREALLEVCYRKEM